MLLVATGTRNTCITLVLILLSLLLYIDIVSAAAFAAAVFAVSSNHKHPTHPPVVVAGRHIREALLDRQGYDPRLLLRPLHRVRFPRRRLAVRKHRPDRTMV